MVGPGDDAGVYSLEGLMEGSGLALVETVDIITPLVDDPFIFGAISTANSLSDIYAMGGRPLTALAILGYDSCDFQKEVIKEILRGCLFKLQEAGVALMGGHTVEDPELKFGLSVTGIVQRANILLKDGAVPGDILCLTKPLGTGIATTALKAGRLHEDFLKEIVSWMLLLNDKARDVALAAKARACTDITGFGLIGHCVNMISKKSAKRSGETKSPLSSPLNTAQLPTVDYRLYFNKVPIFSFIKDLIQAGLVPKGAYENLNFFRPFIVTDLSEEDLLILSDPQTSGGLLFSVPPQALPIVERSGLFFSVIGEVVEGSGRIFIE